MLSQRHRGQGIHSRSRKSHLTGQPGASEESIAPRLESRLAAFDTLGWGSRAGHALGSS